MCFSSKPAKKSKSNKSSWQLDRRRVIFPRCNTRKSADLPRHPLRYKSGAGRMTRRPRPQRRTTPTTRASPHGRVALTRPCCPRQRCEALYCYMTWSLLGATVCGWCNSCKNELFFLSCIFIWNGHIACITLSPVPCPLVSGLGRCNTCDN